MMKTDNKFIIGLIIISVPILLFFRTGVGSEVNVQSLLGSWCQEDFHFSKDNPLLLSTTGLGPLQYSITEVEFRSICPTARDTVWYDGEGNEMRGTTIIFGTSNIGFATWRQQNLHRIYISDARVITEYGISVSSRLSKIRQVWGELEAGYDDAGVYMWSSKEAYISYLVDANIFNTIPSPDDVAKNPAIVPDSSIIKKIIFSPDN